MLCKKTDSNIAAVFKPTILFTDEATQLSPGLGATFPQLKTFVNDFVRGSFLGNVRQELNSKVKGASEELERVVEKHVDKGANSNPGSSSTSAGLPAKLLLKSTWDMYNLVGYLCSLTFDLPHYATDFLSMLQSILIQYRVSVLCVCVCVCVCVCACISRRGLLAQGTCRLRYNSQLKSKQGPSQLRRTGSILAAEWQHDDRVLKTVRSSPAWRSLVPNKVCVCV